LSGVKLDRSGDISLTARELVEAEPEQPFPKEGRGAH
jgi:hypothetical protein